MPGDNKTEKATPKKRRDERKKGNVFTSKDIITVVSLFGSFYALKVMAPYIYAGSKEFLVECLSFVGTIDTLGNEDSGFMLVQLMICAGKICIPLLLVSVVLAILATGVQSKFLFTMKNAAPKFNRINPLEGIKKMFSLKSVVQLIKSMIKISILLVILYQYLQKVFPGMIRTMEMELENSAAYMADSIIQMIMQITMWFIVVAFFDFLYEWWDYERQLKMSKQEVKEEYKQLEGDPQIKGKIKSLQRERARNRMMQAVPQADVIIRNPTHVAVALKYDFEKDVAPVVIAKGLDQVALRIVAIAEENHIEVIENVPLARSIYSSTELNRTIPPELYSVVAEILVYVYKLKQGKGKT